MLSLEKLEPVLLVRSFWAACPESLELISFAELVSDLAPEEVVRTVAAVEGGDVGACEGRRVGHFRTVGLAEPGVLGEQAEADQ